MLLLDPVSETGASLLGYTLIIYDLEPDPVLQGLSFGLDKTDEFPVVIVVTDAFLFLTIKNTPVPIPANTKIIINVIIIFLFLNSFYK